MTRGMSISKAAAHPGGYVGPKGDDGVGALARKELLGATRCLEEFDARRQHSEGMRLVKATYRKPRKLETGLRRKPRLDMVGRSHEENLMPTVAQLIGQRASAGLRWPAVPPAEMTKYTADSLQT